MECTNSAVLFVELTTTRLTGISASMALGGTPDAMAPITEVSGTGPPITTCRGRSHPGTQGRWPPILRLPGQSRDQRSQATAEATFFCVTAGSWSSLRGWWSVTLGKFAARVEVTRAARTGVVIDDGHAVARRWKP